MASYSRRRALAALGAWSIAAISGLSRATAAGAGFVERKKLALGVQLYTLGEELEQNLEATLEAIARVGYMRVEMAGFLGRKASELRQAFDRAGLRCTSAHIPFEPLGGRSGASLQDEAQVIEDAHTIGWKHVIVPIFPFPPNVAPPTSAVDAGRFFSEASKAMTADAWRAFADRLNEKGSRLARANLKLGYHNHNVEFAPLGDTIGYDILLRHTDPAMVTFEIDAGWVAAAGLDPIALLKRYPGRFQLMHVKDIQGSTRPNYAVQQDPAEVGSGSMDWKRIFPAAYAAGIRDFFVEQEPPFVTSRLAAIDKSFRYLMSL